MAYSWQDLAGLALARQFPDVMERDAAAVAEAIRRTGPIQSQTARSPFLALAARVPGFTLETVSAAYEDLLIVRGSNIRGTVHTSTPEDNALLEVATRLGLRALWNRTLKLDEKTLEEVWSGIEEFARDDWRTPDEVAGHLRSWVAHHDPGANPALDASTGRALSFGHGGLVRRPLVGGWQGQGAPGYRSASALLGDRRTVLADPNASMDQLVRRHLTCHGPASRHDLAWWSGVGLRVIDECLQRLAEELSAEDGPDGRTYHDVRDMPGPIELPGVRMLPEFDALLCAYEPKARARFVTPEHHDRLWLRANGMLLAPILVDGRVSGYWRVPGPSRSRPCEVTYFTGTRRPAKTELVEPIAALEAAYGITVAKVAITRE